MMVRTTGLLALVVAVGSLAPAAAGDTKAEDRVIEGVLAKLKEKRERGWNERYKIDFDMPTGKDKIDFQVDWKTGMFRLHGVVASENPHEGVEVFDGKQLKTHFQLRNADKSPKGDWRYGLVTGEQRNQVFVAHYWPIFFNRGVLKGSSTDVFYPGHFSFDPPSVVAFFLHKQERAGKLVTLRTFPETPTRKNFYEYTFDLEKDCAVTGFRFWMDDEEITRLEVEMKKWGERRAPAGWVLTRYPARKDRTVAKAKVTSFEPDVPVTEENAYDIVPPEGAKVGRSDFGPKDKQGAPTINFYEYEVKDGKLVQISGPIASFWMRLGNWRWGIAALGFFGTAAVILRRFRIRR